MIAAFPPTSKFKEIKNNQWQCGKIVNFSLKVRDIMFTKIKAIIFIFIIITYFLSRTHRPQPLPQQLQLPECCLLPSPDASSTNASTSKHELQPAPPHRPPSSTGWFLAANEHAFPE